jgi:hypothetical protein
MTCDDCGARCHGSRCARCAQIASAEAQLADTETYPCPECRRASSGPETVCYRCRGGGDE